MVKLKYFALAIIMGCFSLILYSRDYSPTDIVNPNVADRSKYVADPEGLLSGAAKERADNMLWKLRQQTGVEAVVAIIPSIGDYSEEDFATELFSKWGVGKSDKDNGVLVLIVPGNRAARIATGYGVEGIIPDISARKIIERSIVPHMRNNDIDGAVMAVSADLYNVLSDPDAAAELKSKEAESWNQPIESDITTDDIIGFIGCIAILIFLFSTAKYFYDASRLRKKDRYEQAISWHREQSYYTLFAIMSLGLGLIPLLLARYKYKKARNSPMQCPACKGKMKKLNEEEDNNLLSPSQDFEERLNTVDYDVWVCEDCGTVERFPFKTKQLKYEECPHCHTIAMSMIRDHTLIPPTTRKLGLGEKLYECKYCHNRTSRRYSIPKKVDGTAAAMAAGAILGSGRGGGGGFGGGFGGGSTGGGGATGHW